MQPGSTDALLAAEFFELVDGLLRRPMAALGYHRLQGSVNDQPESRGVLTSTGGKRARTPFLWYQVGFEAGSDEVKRLVGPEDPENEDEWYVNYEPSTGLLELRDWNPVVGDKVDWDIRRDEGPCSALEVHRRLAAVGQAVLTFVQRRGGFPIMH